MKKKSVNRKTIMQRIRSADPYAVVRSMAAVLLVALVAVVCLLFSSGRANRQVGREMFCRINVMSAEALSESGNALNNEPEKTEKVLSTGAFGEDMKFILCETDSGNIIYNSAQDFGFTGTHTGFLKNYRFVSGFGGEKMFSDISRELSGYTEILVGRTKYSLAYSPVSEKETYLFSVIPKRLLYKTGEGAAWEFALSLSSLILLGVIFTVISLIGILKANGEQKNTAGRYIILKKILHQLADEDDTGIYIYRKSDGKLDVIKDEKGVLDDIETVADGMGFLTFGFDEFNSRKIRNTIALASFDKDMTLYADKNGVGFKYTFSAARMHGGNNVVLCTVKRAPAKGETDVSAQAIKRAIENYNTTCIEIFLERNMWHFLWSNEESFNNSPAREGMQYNYDLQLEKEILPLIHRADRERFFKELNRLCLLELFRGGKAETSIKYRILCADGTYSARTLDVRIYRDNNNDEIKANLYVRNV